MKSLLIFQDKNHPVEAPFTNYQSARSPKKIGELFRNICIAFHYCKCELFYFGYIFYCTYMQYKDYQVRERSILKD